MTTRIASCSCGQLRVICAADPVRISICHCLECQKRTGSVFAVQARFPRGALRIEGEARAWARKGESGQSATFGFCPICSSTVYWAPSDASDILYVAVGAFADPSFPPPSVSVYEERMHPWAAAVERLPLERHF